jgi:hypothetical protein
VLSDVVTKRPVGVLVHRRDLRCERVRMKPGNRESLSGPGGRFLHRAAAYRLMRAK